MQWLLSERIRHRLPFAYVLLVFSYVIASKISLIYVQGCEKRNPTQIHKLWPKIRSGNLNSVTSIDWEVLRRCRALNLNRYCYREAIKELSRRQELSQSIHQVSRGVELFVCRCRKVSSKCRAIYLQVSSYLSNFNEQIFFTCFLVQSS